MNKLDVIVSVITPLYNGKNYIENALRSVLAQTYKNIETIVVDDGSCDGGMDLVRNLGNAIVFLSKNNGGAGSAIQFGLRHTHGKYIAFCDQDDWYLPEKLQKQVEYLEDHNDIDLVYSDAYIGDENDAITKYTWTQIRKVVPCEGGYKECVKELFKRNFICAPLVVMVRKSALDAIGGVREEYTGAYDYDVWFRLLKNGSRFGYINEPLAVWRSHSQNESRNIRKAKRIQTKILLDFLKQSPFFIVRHPMLVFIKMMRIIGAFVLNFNPYR